MIHWNSTSYQYLVSLTDVYLSLDGTVIPNHGYVEISDIGSTDDFALLCHTNFPPPPGSTTSIVLSFNQFLSISHRDPDKFQTTSNEAYNLVRQTTAVEAEYEIPQNIPPPPPPSSSRPTTTTTAGDSLYEPV